MSRQGVVLMEQQQTEIYVGESGYVVIKQQDWQDEPQTILIAPSNLKAICDAMLAMKDEAEQTFQEWKQKDGHVA